MPYQSLDLKSDLWCVQQFKQFCFTTEQVQNLS